MSLVHHIRWPKYWSFSFSFSISPSNEQPRLISFRIDWLDLFAVQGTLKSLLQNHSSKEMRKNFVPDRSGDMVRCAELVLEARSSFSRCSLSTYSIEVGPRVYRGSNTRHLPLREIGERWSTENKLMICFQMEYRWSTENNMMISESNIESMEHRCTKCLI